MAALQQPTHPFADCYETLPKDIDMMLYLLNVPVGDSREGICVWDPFVGPMGASQDHIARRGYHRLGLTYDAGAPRAPADADFIVTNPPFSDKAAILRKFLSWGVPFAMILPTACIQTKYMAELFDVGTWDVYFPDCRLGFALRGYLQKTPPFLSCYVVWRPSDTPDVRMHYLRRKRVMDHFDEYFN